MPELPEVETIRRDLEKVILNKKIVSLEIVSSKTAKNSAAFFKKKLLNNHIQKIDRRGKLLIFDIAACQDYLLIHLKMTGQLIYLKGNDQLSGGHSLSQESFIASVGGDLPNKYSRVFFNFKDGGRLFFNDLRKFGYLKIVNEKELESLLNKNYGPEALDQELNEEYLRQIFKNRTRPIKSLLLDQTLIAGLGNIYVDEALFASGIRPDRDARKVKAIELKKLVKEIKRIINLAIKNRGTTFSDYRDSKGNKGNYSRLLKVYGREKQKCQKCEEIIVKIKLGGRGTHYCPSCQK